MALTSVSIFVFFVFFGFLGDAWADHRAPQQQRQRPAQGSDEQRMAEQLPAHGSNEQRREEQRREEQRREEQGAGWMAPAARQAAVAAVSEAGGQQRQSYNYATTPITAPLPAS